MKADKASLQRMLAALTLMFFAAAAVLISLMIYNYTVSGKFNWGGLIALLPMVLIIAVLKMTISKK